MKSHKSCHNHEQESFKKHVKANREWVKELNRFNKKHHHFSKKVFLTFGVFTIVTLLTANLIVSGVFSFVRFNYQNSTVDKNIDAIINFINTETDNVNQEYFENFIYQDIFIKVENLKNNDVIFDTYTGFWKNNPKANRFLSVISRELEIDSKYRLSIIKDLRDEKKLVSHYIIIMLVINLLFVGMIIRVSKVITLRLLLPINHIIKTAENIDANNLSERVPVFPIDDELSRLGRVINSMIDRLEKSFSAQKRFVSDSSHELRTPLQIIKGYTDLALSKKDNKAILEEALTNVKEEIENMIDLTENLLFLAKSEGQNFKLNKKELNLFQLFNRIKSDLSLTNKDVQFSTLRENAITIFADEKLVLQAFRAVIDNAIKYSTSDKTIQIEYSKNKDYTNIAIIDNGVGIPEENLCKLFDRFYRVDEARSKDISGTGLGLSIVKNIIELHNGNISIESKENIGTSVIFKFPN